MKNKGEKMKKVMFSLPLVVGLLLGAQNQKVEDCVETFQKEVAEILYSNPEDKNASIEMLTKKIKVMFDENCDLEAIKVKSEAIKTTNQNEQVIILDMTKNSQDCIETFQNDLKEILYADETKKAKEKKVKILIKGDGEDCAK